MAQTSIALLVNDNAAPAPDSFKPVTIDELCNIVVELEALAPTGLEWNDATVAGTIETIADVAIPLAEQGIEILAARDEDGWYFARRSEPSQTFAALAPCEDGAECPEFGSRHGHVADDAFEDCSCGATVVLGGIVTDRGATGADGQYPIVYHPSGEWLVRCPGCGAEHVLVDAPAE